MAVPAPLPMLTVKILDLACVCTALWVLERWFQPEVALQVEELLEVERRGTVWRRGQG